MRESIGGSMLLYIVLIFVTVVTFVFSSILTYSKAYKIKNRIIEIIEKYGSYEKKDKNGKNVVVAELNPDLSMSGYDASKPEKCDEIRKKMTTGKKAKYNKKTFGENENKAGYNYCVFKSINSGNGYYYVVVTFVEFQIPIINDVLTFPVYGETQMLGQNYDY